jgi:hypothetical protein
LNCVGRLTLCPRSPGRQDFSFPGGSRGIGAAIFKRLAREGAHVALTYVSKPQQANETVKAAQAFGVKALAHSEVQRNGVALGTQLADDVPLIWLTESNCNK